MIAGVYPIDSGKIEIDGVNISRQPEYKRAKYIGRVFQDPIEGHGGRHGNTGKYGPGFQKGPEKRAGMGNQGQ